MPHTDVSFTFLDRVREIEQNLGDRRWQSALALALTLPDICGGIAFPEMVKRYRDGRIMLDRQKNPTRDVGGQYIRWFDEYAAPYFKRSPRETSPYICGARCWQLRCEYLHQNKGFVNEEGEQGLRFHLGVNCGSSVCRLDQASPYDGGLDIRIDIEQFCMRMCRAAKNYYDRNHRDKAFELYNTPVLDFIRRPENEPRKGGAVAVLCGQRAYAEALRQALQGLGCQIELLEHPGEEEKVFGPGGPDLWIAAEPLPAGWRWTKALEAPLIWLARDPSRPLLPGMPEPKERLALPADPVLVREAAARWKGEKEK